MDPMTLSGYLLALLLGLFQFRRQRGDVWKEEAEAYKAKAERLEQDLAEFRSEFNDYKRGMSERVARLEIENTRLAELASSREAVMNLIEHIQTNHDEVISILKKVA